jgi:hypothetical protein
MSTRGSRDESQGPSNWQASIVDCRFRQASSAARASRAVSDWDFRGLSAASRLLSLDSGPFRSEQINRQRTAMRFGADLRGWERGRLARRVCPRIVARTGGATYPWAPEVTRQGRSVTRFHGGFQSGPLRAFLAPHRAPGVSNRPATTFRAVNVVSVSWPENLFASRVRTAFHHSSVAGWNGTVGNRVTAASVYFGVLAPQVSLRKLGPPQFLLSPVCNFVTVSRARGRGNCRSTVVN